MLKKGFIPFHKSMSRHGLFMKVYTNVLVLQGLGSDRHCELWDLIHTAMCLSESLNPIQSVKFATGGLLASSGNISS